MSLDNKKHISFLPSSVKNSIRSKIKNFAIISFMSIGVLIFLSLITYHPSDSSFNSLNSEDNIHYGNMLGGMGAYISDILLQIFGYSSYLLCVFPLSWGVIMMRKSLLVKYNQFLALFGLILTLAIALGTLPVLHGLKLPVSYGGIAGSFFISWLNKSDSTILEFIGKVFLFAMGAFFSYILFNKAFRLDGEQKQKLIDRSDLESHKSLMPTPFENLQATSTEFNGNASFSAGTLSPLAKLSPEKRKELEKTIDVASVTPLKTSDVKSETIKPYGLLRTMDNQEDNIDKTKHIPQGEVFYDNPNVQGVVPKNSDTSHEVDPMDNPKSTPLVNELINRLTLRLKEMKNTHKLDDKRTVESYKIPGYKATVSNISTPKFSLVADNIEEEEQQDSNHMDGDNNENITENQEDTSPSAIMESTEHMESESTAEDPLVTSEQQSESPAESPTEFEYDNITEEQPLTAEQQSESPAESLAEFEYDNITEEQPLTAEKHGESHTESPAEFEYDHMSAEEEIPHEIEEMAEMDELPLQAIEDIPQYNIIEELKETANAPDDYYDTAANNDTTSTMDESQHAPSMQDLTPPMAIQEPTEMQAPAETESQVLATPLLDQKNEEIENLKAELELLKLEKEKAELLRAKAQYEHEIKQAQAMPLPVQMPAPMPMPTMTQQPHIISHQPQTIYQQVETQNFVQQPQAIIPAPAPAVQDIYERSQVQTFVKPQAIINDTPEEQQQPTPQEEIVLSEAMNIKSLSDAQTQSIEQQIRELQGLPATATHTTPADEMAEEMASDQANIPAFEPPTIQNELMENMRNEVNSNPLMEAPREDSQHIVNPFRETAINDNQTPTPAPAIQPTAEDSSDHMESVADNITQEPFILPNPSFLDESDEDNIIVHNELELAERAKHLEEALRHYKIQGEVMNVQPGPVVTLFEFEPQPGTKTSKVVNLAEDIARSLSAVSVRIAPIPGKSVIGIEMPNEEREMVNFRELVEDPSFANAKGALPFILGKDIGGTPKVVDLSAMPHLLVSGTTGSGKSVAINTLIMSLLYRFTPDELRLVMVDPKMLEFAIYEDIPHLLTPIVTESDKAVNALQWAMNEMNDRYKLMADAKVRNIEGFNKKITKALDQGDTLYKNIVTGFNRETGQNITEKQAMDMKKLPYIAIIIDELADLMITAGKEVEPPIQSLAQKARAAGIHLILATQRPSVNVITGTIKANFPSRMSFQLTSRVDSRTILDENGAEQLLGRGDMLYKGKDSKRPIRLHGPFVSDDEVEKTVEFLKSQGKPFYIQLEAPKQETTNATQTEEHTKDPLYDQAVEAIMQDGKASTSFIQR